MNACENSVASSELHLSSPQFVFSFCTLLILECSAIVSQLRLWNQRVLFDGGTFPVEFLCETHTRLGLFYLFIYYFFFTALPASKTVAVGGGHRVGGGGGGGVITGSHRETRKHPH